MIAQAKRSPIVSLSVEQTAQDLDIDTLSVMRLVARKRIAATRLGESGQYRILPSVLEKYLAAGAPDLAPVETDGRGWLSPFARPFSTRGDFPEHLARAAETALLADPGALERIATADVELPEYTPSLTGDMLAAVRAPLPGASPELAALRARFTTWTALYVAEMVREFARQIISTPPKLGSTPAARFYDSPQTYAETVMAAGLRLAAATISRTTYIDVETPEGQATKRAVRLVVPVAALMTAVGLRVPDVAELAF